MWGTPPTLKGFFPGDDAQDPDIFDLVALNINPATTTDLLWQGFGTAGPITPTNYVEKIVSLWLANKGGTGGNVTIYALNTVAATSAFVPVAEYYLAADSSFQVSTEQFRILAPPNCKFQVVTTTTADVVAAARYVKGAGT